ncbi:cytochrome c1 [Saccharobesus litoralis]|uniref:Cytochrome c1 n=1 Tax=Saccharobesus litoralis TaxID=2172099 RepID=A0A2S0VWZ9_9ALTE|nr:cytochrome c1 [Saccharobesus litoralis]AWB68630.1 cytochrome c1 [Saccharobesus litoralis]
MRKLIIALFALVPSLALSAGGPSVPLDPVDIDLTDKASIQNGMKIFMNYCLGCHQQQYQRYQRTAEDNGISMEILKENLMFTGEKTGDHIKNSMPAKDAKEWFGSTPPDLTMVARVRKPEWIYTYLRSFYVDPSRPFGVNNTVFPNVGMPHVLQSLQGIPTKVAATAMVDGEEGVKQGERIVVDGSGELSPEEFDSAMRDLVNYLVYTAEPTRLQSEKLGTWVIGFLLIFFVFIYLLKKEYWRDVH